MAIGKEKRLRVKITTNLFCFFSNSEGLDLNHDHVDLRGLGDLKGHSTFAVFFQTAKV
jgi:hypothetical protein